MGSKRKRRFLVIVGLASLGWTVFVIIYTPIFVQNDPWAQMLLNPSFDWGPTLTTYDVVSVSPNFTERWRASDIYINQSFIGRSALVALEEGLFFVGSNNPNDFPILQKMNIQTGSQEWQGQQIDSFSLLVAGSKQNVVVGSSIPGTVTVFDALSGEVVAEKTFSFTIRGVDYILAAEDKLFVNTSPVRFHVLEEDIVHQPVFTEETILVRTGESTGHIYALDRLTGETIWSSEPGVVSNVAASENWVYYLTNESHLHVADIQTGMLVADIIFAPAILELDGFDQVNSDFYVATTDDMVVVYFGSGRQLFAFQQLPEE